MSCDGTRLKELTIESDFDKIKFEGAAPIIYFNKKNDIIRVSRYGNIIHNYIFKLTPNCKYTITKYNGYDRGPIQVTFKTNNAGLVESTSKEHCD